MMLAEKEQGRAVGTDRLPSGLLVYLKTGEMKEISPNDGAVKGKPQQMLTKSLFSKPRPWLSL